MYQTKSGRHFGNPQIGKAIDRQNQHAKPSSPHQESPAHEDHALVPHPHTGVTKVEIQHHGGGRASVHAHHADGGTPHVTQHADLADAHQQAAEHLPPEGGHQEPDGDEAGAISAMAGEMGGGDEYGD